MWTCKNLDMKLNPLRDYMPDVQCVVPEGPLKSYYYSDKNVARQNVTRQNAKSNLLDAGYLATQVGI